MVQPPPRDGKVRLRREADAAGGWVIACAVPCGGNGRCLNRGEHPGLGPLPASLQGVCWLGWRQTEEAARWLAECQGWTVVGSP